ncbi:2Fe-2S iron-sulfur cluster-binding protein [Conchiformibius kuhniae]|uniref:2Fe-2S iron-sulfur cluster-binding protein n=1 Tax=Conchiformibius kuhniae TaxID=211502 RepID=A0A8T9MY31_9NEIS|nr:2Fe-2S iron-sulfur cluster-binding protein [Conchiformibius kuhniae]
MPQITISPSQTVFTAESGETILAAALRNGHNLPHACQSGVCGSCRARLVSGKVLPNGEYDDYVLTPDEHAAGMVLLCCNRADGDVEVDMPAYAGAKAVTVRTVPARVLSVDVRGADIAVLKVALPKAPPFKFYAGQYMDVLLKDGSRSYSVANAPAQTDVLEFHIRRHDKGLFSPMLFDGRVKTGTILRLRGPLGGFTLNGESSRPMIFLGTGTGFAPLKSLLAHLADTAPYRPVHLYHGVRHADELYDESELNNLLSRLYGARYTPVLSRPDAAWTGATGYVQQQLERDYPDLTGCEAYACGSPAMIAAARSVCLARGLDDAAFYSDAFVSN